MSRKQRNLNEYLATCPGLAGRVARYIDSTQETSQPGIALATSFAFIAALRSGRIKNSEGIAPSLYTLVLAYSGAGKTRAQRVVHDICRAANVKNFLMGKPASDSGILSRLQKTPRQLLVWDEFGQALGEMSASSASYRVAIISTVMELYSSAGGYYIGKEYAKDERVDIDRPLLSISAASTPEEFCNALTRQFVEKGFLSRWLVFAGSPVKGFRNEPYRGAIPADIIEDVSRMHEGVRNTGPGDLAAVQPPLELPVSFESRTSIILAAARSRAEASTNEPERIVWSRTYENWLKVAMVIADDAGLCPVGPFVSDYNMMFAWQLVEQLAQDLIANIVDTVHDNTKDRDKARRVERFQLLLRPGQSLSKQALSKRCNKVGFTGNEKDQLLKSLLDSGEWIEERRYIDGSPKFTTYIIRVH